MISIADIAFTTVSDSPTTLGRALAALGRENPIVFDERMGTPVVLRHRDVSAGLRDTATFSTRFYGVGPMAASIVAQDGPEHLRQRRIHRQFFGPDAISRYERYVQPIAARVFGTLPGPSVELIKAAIAGYPMQVFLNLLGIPDELGNRGQQWTRDIIRWLGSPMNETLVGSGMHAFRELSDYANALVARERENPDDNLLGEIIRAHLDEDEFSSEACVVVIAQLLLAGVETTIQFMSATLGSLLLNPTALDQVHADRSLIDAAMDEGFRWANPTAGLYRLVLRDTKIAGTPLAAGSMVYFCIAAAHYDEHAYPEPEKFDLARMPSHLGFGLGSHYCIGAPLAKIEVRSAINALLDACPTLRLDPNQPMSFQYGARDFVQHGTEAMTVLIS